MGEAEINSDRRIGFAVAVLDMFHYQDPDEEQTITGFQTLEIAREYAKRRTWDSVEEQRAESKALETFGIAGSVLARIAKLSGIVIAEVRT